ncbi:MAG: TetR family transcriptional regulator [Spirochaetales bacterium]|nr:TetR family transcriptional regulator [Spirochaetales bacterium]
MNFERARSREHKEERREEIMNAALALLEVTDYKKITLAGIAQRLSFTRANLYKYVSSKDEIFLWVILRDIERWIDDLRETFKEGQSLTNREIARTWAEVAHRHTRLLRLLSLLDSIIEQNVTVEKLAEFKKELFSLLAAFQKPLELILPRLSEKNRHDFILSQLYYASGLYGATQQTELQKRAMEQAGIVYEAPDFPSEMTRFLTIYLDGLEREES